jgi:hypothetical protein
MLCLLETANALNHREAGAASCRSGELICYVVFYASLFFVCDYLLSGK